MLTIDSIVPRIGSCLVELLDNHKSVIIKPENSEIEGTKALVHRVGPDEDIIKGDKVILGKYVGHELMIEGRKFLLVNCSEILAIIEP